MQRQKVKHCPQTLLLDAIVHGMQAKKAEQISIINLAQAGSAVAAYFVLCTAQAKRQVEAITEEVIGTGYRQTGQRPWKQEGMENQEWVLLDYIDVVAHIFYGDKRDLYALDTLWGDMAITHVHDTSPLHPAVYASNS